MILKFGQGAESASGWLVEGRCALGAGRGCGHRCSPQKTQVCPQKPLRGAWMRGLKFGCWGNRGTGGLGWPCPPRLVALFVLLSPRIAKLAKNGHFFGRNVARGQRGPSSRLPNSRRSVPRRFGQPHAGTSPKNAPTVGPGLYIGPLSVGQSPGTLVADSLQKQSWKKGKIPIPKAALRMGHHFGQGGEGWERRGRTGPGSLGSIFPGKISGSLGISLGNSHLEQLGTVLTAPNQWGL